ncbi:MAG: glutamate ligase domain-containing protein [Planctomycetota bacterium]
MTPNSNSDAESGARLSDALARLNTLVDWERRDRDAQMRVTIEPVRDLLTRMGAPHERWRAVHVAGTKGKGTTAALVAEGLARMGAKVGLYTSPHVTRIHERIRIDGCDVGDRELACGLEGALAAREAAGAAGTAGGGATWFDVMTAAAFATFAEAGVEWAVVECGLGGRLDSTNVVRGEVCLVTNVDLEHTAVLGTTRAAIAREKGGILKAGSALVTSLAPDDEAGRVLHDLAARLGCKILRPSRSAPTMLARNADLARLCLDELCARGVRGSRGAASGRLLDAHAIEAARLPGRLERFDVDGVPVVVDAAHVASSVEMVLDELAHDADLRGLPTVVIALGREKDARSILKKLVGRTDRLLCTTVAVGPLRAAEELAAEASRTGLTAEAVAEPAEAFARALAGARGRWVLILGSFYLAGAIRLQIATGPQRNRC